MGSMMITRCSLVRKFSSAGGVARKSLWMFAALLIWGLNGCKPAFEDPGLVEYRERLKACVDSVAGNRRVHIIGGGEIDISRFDFYVPHMSVKDDGECGAVGFEAEFYWTGKKIVTQAAVPRVDLPGYSNLKVREVPPEWRLLRVAARLGNRKLGQQCKAHFDPNKCPDPNEKPLLPSPTWPEHLTVRPKAYPGLEMRLPRSPSEVSRSSSAGFFTTDFPRRDGITPHVISCWSHEELYEVNLMTPTQLEQIDFGNRTFPCDINHFSFKGGAARISTGTEALRDIVPALRALQQYLSDSIIKED